MPSLIFNLPLFSRWNRERLLKKQADLGPRAYARGFRQQAFSDDERTFPSFLTAAAKCAGVRVRDLYSPGSVPTFAGVDLSSDGRPGTVIFVAAVLPNGLRIPVEIARGRWNSPDTLEKINELFQRHKMRAIFVENNGYQQALIDWARSSSRNYQFWPLVRPFTTGRNKMRPDEGLPSLEVELNAGAWIVPAMEWYGHPENCECGWCAWRKEVEFHPAHVTTDTVMAWWFCREAILLGQMAPVTTRPFTTQIGAHR